jgi:hypothetical protein
MSLDWILSGLVMAGGLMGFTAVALGVGRYCHTLWPVGAAAVGVLAAWGHHPIIGMLAVAAALPFGVGVLIGGVFALRPASDTTVRAETAASSARCSLAREAVGE